MKVSDLIIDKEYFLNGIAFVKYKGNKGRGYYFESDGLNNYDKEPDGKFKGCYGFPKQALSLLIATQTL